MPGAVVVNDAVSLVPERFSADLIVDFQMQEGGTELGTDVAGQFQEDSLQVVVRQVLVVESFKKGRADPDRGTIEIEEFGIGLNG